MSTPEGPRVVVYYKPNEPSNVITLNEIAKNVDPDTNTPFVTHVEIRNLHLKRYHDGYTRLNDYLPSNFDFEGPRHQITNLQDSGIRFLFLLGGNEGTSGTSPKSDSTWVNLFNDFDVFYPALARVIQDWKVNGVDLDIQNPDMWEVGVKNEHNVCKLVDRMKSDFGDDFDIALSPIASALYQDDPSGGLSGFDYFHLMMESGCQEQITWLNVKFFDGYGTLMSPHQYETAVDRGYKANQLVAGTEYFSSEQRPKIRQTIESLSEKYGSGFGGVSVWYSNDISDSSHKELNQWCRDMYHTIYASNINDNANKVENVVGVANYNRVGSDSVAGLLVVGLFLVLLAILFCKKHLTKVLRRQAVQVQYDDEFNMIEDGEGENYMAVN